MRRGGWRTEYVFSCIVHCRPARRARRSLLMATARRGFEAILLDRSWVSAQDLDKARQRKKPGQELADVLVEMGALEPQRLARARAQEYRLAYQAHIDENSLDPVLVSRIPINYAKKNRLLPLSIADGVV